VTHNESPEIVKPDTPFGVKSVVTPVVTWSGGSRLVHVRTGGAYKRTCGYLCVEGSSRDQGAISAQGIGRSKDREVKQTLLRWGSASGGIRANNFCFL
jgi:hypothetical protein